MASDFANRVSALQELDRRKTDTILIHRAKLATTHMRRLVLAAFHMGTDISLAVRVGLKPLQDDMKKAAAEAHLRGMYRTHLNVQRYARANGIQLSSAFDGAIEFLLKQLELSPKELDELQLLYQTTAIQATKDLGDEANRAATGAVLENTAAGGSVKDGIRLINEALDNAGVTPLQNHTVEAIVRTQTQLAYSAGRVNSLSDDSLQDILWGYEYSSIHDDRTRPTHREMDGVRAPKDDPIWNIWTPPNGYNCRCSINEIFADQKEARTKGINRVSNLEPDKGFAFNPGDVYNSTIPFVASRLWTYERS